MRSPVVEVLADLAAACSGMRVPWLLFGAQAAILHGVARLTADVDVIVRLPAKVSVDTLVKGLEGTRFRPKWVDLGFIERSRVVPFIHIPTDMPLDVVLAGSGLEDMFFERMQWREIEGVRVPLASPEDMIVMKVLAGRPKDLEDVSAIAAAYDTTLDLTYIESTLETLEQALSQGDLLPALRQAIARGHGFN